MIKRMTILMICLVCLFSNSVIVFAEEDVELVELRSNTTEVFEYDIIKAEIEALSKTSVFDKAAKTKIKEIEESVSTKIVSLSSMSKQELISYGYNEAQIEIIKKYSGGCLKNNEQLREVLSTLTITATPSVAVYTNHIGAAYFKLAIMWTWSSQPVLSGPLVEDGVGVIWQAINSSGQFVAARINTSESYCNVYYYNSSGIMQTHTSSSLTVVEQLRNAKAKVPMGVWASNNVDTYWAKKGGITLRTDRVSSNYSLVDMEYKFAYGHATISINPKVTVNFALTNPQQIGVLGSITFTKGQKMAEKCFYVDTDDQTVIYY